MPAKGCQTTDSICLKKSKGLDVLLKQGKINAFMKVEANARQLKFGAIPVINKFDLHHHQHFASKFSKWHDKLYNQKSSKSLKNK